MVTSRLLHRAKYLSGSPAHDYDREDWRRHSLMGRQSEEAVQSPGCPEITIAGVTAPFTDGCQAAMASAREAARMYHHRYLGTEHLLLGLLSVDDGVAAQVLISLGITEDRVRTWIDYRIGQGSNVEDGDVDFAPKARQALQLAIEEHGRLGHLHASHEATIVAAGAELVRFITTSFPGWTEAVYG